MSEVETAVDGAEVAPVDNAQDQVQTPTAEQVETPEQQQARDDKGRFVPQERVNEITRARREAERNWQSAEQRAQQAEQQLAQYQRQPSQQPQGNEAPKPADYGWDLDAWGVALTQYAESKANASVESRLNGQEAQRQREQVQQGYAVKAQKYETDNPGYSERIAGLDSVVQFRPEVIEAIGLNDHGPAIADYLATHLDEADQLARLPAHLAAVQIGRLEVRVSTSKPKPVTNAPTPSPTLGGASLAKPGLHDALPIEEWMARARNS